MIYVARLTPPIREVFVVAPNIDAAVKAVAEAFPDDVWSAVEINERGEDGVGTGGGG